MRGALTLAGLALGSTSPNPAVGAVVVKEGVVVGMGHTQPPGSWHAEVMALRQAGPRAHGATLYVTLEPCCHYGRTPPCTGAIIDSGITEVHVATEDPNPLVSGKGILALKQAGIRLVRGELEAEAREVIEAYTKHVTTGMPFVTVKLGMSLDGKIATRTGDSRWITCEESRVFVHKLRHAVDAVMVGVNTIRADNPRLTARLCSGRGGRPKKQPIRIVVDGKGSTPVTAQIFSEPGDTIIALAAGNDVKDVYSKAGCSILEMAPSGGRQGWIDLRLLLRELGNRDLMHILVEGGGRLVGSLFDAGLVDRLIIFIAPIVIGGAGAVAVGGLGASKVCEAVQLDRAVVTRSGRDVMVSGYPKKIARSEASCSPE
ncbi:MAG: bifunctional diaminohydroxyphosphoribosylaminopyrimidine deaminase/5-amino-6-(5-phosphoribosylamino)uracil reductase RibD [Chloroflexi bacterium]|nr:bifunctional diaminohydroxyphosphoribosylaminopyrimidine deaminase/5-amino-6-(5-phosphoribosylamino)uracil reductase RibD [Chloroflexota bacterium]